MTSNKEATIFSTWSTAVVVQVLSAFYSRRFSLCRDGVVGFFIRVSVLFSRAVGAPSEEESTSSVTNTAVLTMQYISLFMVGKWVPLSHKC